MASKPRNYRSAWIDARKHLRDLSLAVTAHLERLDAEMVLPSDMDRGKRIAVIANGLNLQNDIARRFGLGMTTPKPRRKAGRR